MQTFELPKYAGKQGTGTFRTPVDVDEMDAHCTAHAHIWFRSIDGSARQAKVNGKVRRWKKDRARIEVPVKYGLYECGTLTLSDLDRVLIPVLPADPGNAPTINHTPANSGLAPTLSR